MAQHDFSIDNQSAPAFRGDLNNALEALATLSSGASAPSTTYANMLWYDTANNILYMRSEADDAWISIGTLDQGTNTFSPAGVAELTQTQVEDDTSTVFGQVSGERLDQKIVDRFNLTGTAPTYACRAWVNFNGTGTVAIRASGNVSSITDNGTGDYTVNFTTAMPDADYAPVLGMSTGGPTDTRNGTGFFYDISSSSCAFVSGNSSINSKSDRDTMTVAIFR